MNKLFKYAFFFCLSALTFVACTDLEVDLVGEITEDITVTPIGTGGGGGGGGGALTAVYAELRSSGTANHGGYYAIQEITSDEMLIGAKGGDWFDGGDLIKLHQHTYESSHGFMNNTWTAQYNAIATANGKLGDGSLTPEETAQARGVRAYFYWRLMDAFGSVKIATETDPDPPQVDRATVFAFVENELLDILGVAEVTAGMDLSGSLLNDGGNAYVFNRYAALGILAKLYLNAEVYVGTAMYDKAEICADQIITSGKYILCTDATCSVPNLGARAGVPSDPENLTD